MDLHLLSLSAYTYTKAQPILPLLIYHCFLYLNYEYAEHAAFTIKELRELINTTTFVFPTAECQNSLHKADMNEISKNRPKSRIIDLMKAQCSKSDSYIQQLLTDSAAPSSTGDAPQPMPTLVEVKFHRTPIAILPNAGGDRIGSVVYQVACESSSTATASSNADLSGSSSLPLSPPTPPSPPSPLSATPPAIQEERLPCDLLIKSTGYRSVPLPGVPFDFKRSVIPSRQGRVLLSAER